MELLITKSSIINSYNSDGKLHLFMTEKERPCSEATLTVMNDKDGAKCSRFTIKLDSIEELDRLGEKSEVDILVTKNPEFSSYIAIVLYDEEIDQSTQS
ncbi:hypothetical protein JFL43_20605 [Viridibacillus sp. YIM B01967]|uniref:Fe-S cluster assembly protein HesB n=1 Tax=Viridibacillus soli TaxID=2798301 RepID=A0ABS1HCL3_9BACL|nr:hypothetical protein [Viridibacillus soli]MBK3497184.1 hypothetical protein [Viridibacillus soli]